MDSSDWVFILMLLAEFTRDTLCSRSGTQLASNYAQHVPNYRYTHQSVNGKYVYYYGLYGKYARLRTTFTPSPDVLVCVNYEANEDGDVLGVFTCPQGQEPDDFIHCCGDKYAEYCCQPSTNNSGIVAAKVLGIVAVCIAVTISLYYVSKKCQKKGKQLKVVEPSREANGNYINQSIYDNEGVQSHPTSSYPVLESETQRSSYPEFDGIKSHVTQEESLDDYGDSDSSDGAQEPVTLYLNTSNGMVIPIPSIAQHIKSPSVTARTGDYLEQTTPGFETNRSAMKYITEAPTSEREGIESVEDMTGVSSSRFCHKAQVHHSSIKQKRKLQDLLKPETARTPHTPNSKVDTQKSCDISARSHGTQSCDHENCGSCVVPSIAKFLRTNSDSDNDSAKLRLQSIAKYSRQRLDSQSSITATHDGSKENLESQLQT